MENVSVDARLCTMLERGECLVAELGEMRACALVRVREEVAKEGRSAGGGELAAKRFGHPDTGRRPVGDT